jgi:protein-tyrosine phosphatase
MESCDQDPPGVVFICTGNYYRSRFAEALFNHLAQLDGSPWRAFSRGVDIDLAPPGLSPYTAAWLQRHGLPFNLTTIDRNALTVPDLERATLRIALKEAEHRPYIQRDFPEWEDRIEYWHFHDLDCATAEEMLPQLGNRVRALYESLSTTE